MAGKRREPAVYALMYFASGKVKRVLVLYDLAAARREYFLAFARYGITPRMFADGKRLTIREADTLTGFRKWADTGLGGRGKE